ncbi:hypothetical protein L9G15_00525 [Shewanella sp. A3A]|nr:hypothetical protein [Shewanella ferrihydritica]
MTKYGALALTGWLIWCAPLLAVPLSYSGDASREHYLYESSQQVLAWIQANDVAALADSVNYPVTIGGSEPEVSIHDADEFTRYFPHLFTETLRQQLRDSTQPSITWRGARVADGALWLTDICDDDQCQQVTVAITSFYSPEFYQQPFGRQAQQRLQQRMAADLPEELLPIKQNNLLWQTKNYLVRVDTLTDGQLRYAVWSAGNAMNSKPDLVLHNGEMHYDGSGGNYYYLFANGKYVYRLDVVILGTAESPAGYLRVTRGERTLVEQPVVKVLTAQ